MKHLLFSLLMLMAIHTAHAYCVVFTPQGQYPTQTDFNITIDDTKLIVDHAIDDGTYFKISAYGYLDFNAPYTHFITKVVLEFACPDDEPYGPSHIWSYTGGYSYDGIYGFWEGEKRGFALSVNNEVWIKRILVYIDRQEPLSIFPRSTTQYGNYKVNISSSYYDAKIYYTLDGSTPTVNSTEFLNSFSLNSDATVKAIVARDGVVIDSASISYQYVTNAASVKNIQEGLALPDETAFTFRNPIRVVKQMGPYLWVKDASGYALIIGDCSQDYVRGNEINRGESYPYHDFGVTKATVNGIPVFIKPGGFYTTRRGLNEEIEPEAVSINQVNMDNMFAHYVYLDSLRISSQDGGQSYRLTDKSGNTCPADFTTMNIKVPDDLETLYNIWAIVGTDSNGSPELKMLMAPANIDGEEPLVISPSQVGPSTCGHQVFIKQVLDYDVCNICDVEGESCVGYAPFGGPAAAVSCWCYDIGGEVESYKYWESSDYVTGYRLRMISISGHSNTLDTADVERIKSLYRLRDIQYFHLTGHFTKPLTAVYQNGDYLYVRDSYGDYGLILGSIDEVFTNGDMIYDAKATSYNDGGVDFISAVVPSSFTVGGHQAAVSPEVLAIQDVTSDRIHHYIRFDRVRLTDGDDQGFRSLVDDTGTLPLNNLFGIEVTTDVGSVTSQYDLNIDGRVDISDVSDLIDRLLYDKSTSGELNPVSTYDVTGFVAMSDNLLQFYPVEIVRYHLDGDTNDDGRVTIDDLTFLIDFILSNE